MFLWNGIIITYLVRRGKRLHPKDAMIRDTRRVYLDWRGKRLHPKDSRTPKKEQDPSCPFLILLFKGLF